jgi:hypothetical protein
LAAEQISPLDVDPNEECHIADAKPLLDSSKYKKESGYVLKTIGKKPLILLESIKLKDGHPLKIEQRGCEDIYFKFTYERPKDSKTAVERVELMANALTELKLSKDALIDEKQVSEISEKVKSATRKTKKIDEMNVCLMKISSECITDVQVTVTPSQVEFFYVDRP